MPVAGIELYSKTPYSYDYCAVENRKEPSGTAFRTALGTHWDRFQQSQTPPPQEISAPSYSVEPVPKSHTSTASGGRLSVEIVIPYAPRPLQASLHDEMQAKR